MSNMLSDNTKNRLLDSYTQHNSFTSDEFLSDANRIVLIAKIIDKWHLKGECNYRLLLNHAIIIKNTFGETGLYALYEYADNFKTLIPAVTSICYYLGYIATPALYDVDLLNQFILIDKKE
jgi:uncharacterized protein YybS (DUF2232 family)